METKICPHDQKAFIPNHGNRQFCSTWCYEEYKLKKQKENNILIKKFRQGFLNNYKLFKELLPDAGHFNIPVFDLLNKKFDQDAFYGISIEKNGNQWHKVNEYYFNISKLNNQPVLYLYKA